MWLWLVNLIGFKRALIVIIVAAVLLFAGVAMTIDSCRNDSINKKLNNAQNSATEQETIANVLTNQRQEVNNELSNAKKDTNNARTNVNTVRDRDSNSFPTADNERKFCEQFPLDSTCREYCAKHKCP